jgi:hypothetical protein
MKKTWLVLGVCLWLLLTACDRSPSGPVVVMGDNTVVFSHQPDPLQVGFDAKLQLKITDKQAQTRHDCKASFRQFMPDMEMAQDHTMMSLSISDDGIYRGTSGPFSMGGEWVLEIIVDCGGGPVSHLFNYHLDWPE